VHCLDLPGFGHQYGRTVPLSIEENVKDLQAQLSTLETRGPLNILAISLGGMVALKWLEIEPERFAKALLVNTSLKGVSSIFKRLKPSAALTLIRASFQSPAEREKRVLGLTSHAQSQNQNLIREWGVYANQRPLDKLNVFRQLWAALNIKVPLKIPTPVELLVSENDQLCDASCSAAIAKLYGGWTVHRHPTAGHDLPLDDPAWVLDRMD